MCIWVASEEDGIDEVGEEADGEKSGIDVPASEELFEASVEMLKK